MIKLTKTFLASLLCAGVIFGGGSSVFANDEESAVFGISADPYALYNAGDLEELGLSSENKDLSFEKVIGADTRTVVPDVKELPYSAICKLVITFSSKGQDLKFIGTGFLINDDTVVTAGHCVYDPSLGLAKSIEVTPAASKSGSAPFGSTVVTSANLHVTDEWKRTSSTDYDFGVLKLDHPLGQKTGTLSIASSPAASVGQLVELSGYPYRSGLRVAFLEQYHDTGTLLKTNKQRTLYHDIDSESGQSGSPILNSRNEVIGIHTFALNNENANGGVLIDSFVRSFIREYAGQSSSSATPVVSVPATPEPIVPAPADPEPEQPAAPDAPSAANGSVYRLYNPASGEHLYTTSAQEAEINAAKGWNQEGISWSNHQDGYPIYRLFNPNSGDHHYTLDLDETAALIRYGWKDEGIAWNSSKNPQAPAVYRLYNPNAKIGAHHFTASTAERDRLIAQGWKNEGIAFRSE